MIDAGTAPGVPGLVLDADLGSGTYGTVWRAVDLGTGEPVAVRVGRPAGGAEAVAREGALLRRLQHEHVVRLRTVVDLPRTADGDDLRALVVDLVPGGSLAGVVDRRGPLPDAEVATVAVAVARALQHLHTHGFVHGRLSARDVLFDVQGRPLVADVGLPALLAPSRPADPDLDADDDVPVYPTPADDVLGLGRLLHEALTADPDADPDGPLAALVVACLDPDPAARPTPDRIAQTARQLVTPRPVDLTAAPTPTVPTAPGWKPLPGRPPATARPVAATHLARPVSPPPPAPPTPFPVSAGSPTHGRPPSWRRPRPHSWRSTPPAPAPTTTTSPTCSG
ncbi:MAG TPA: protein kinase [Kineosporiaceae bacterium]|nr:protein kinase [Kineosporiaceae bacterium]